ncbi:hypothetical protein J7T55_014921 [Diaporthe amygdali]|uniref:uncharacterized protein n=1 Tax=Phomopsis amygdali TaxID=1214568 RepID=UPI0022FDCD05|nr:uncharacterized protein J7T55_014921 [Diaporthe amygdali]KAJ0106845.1 hypothetical protein J7T55_014921 [Diaporthe amygdali]
MADDNLPGLEPPAHQVVRRAPEGAISPTLESLPAELRTILLMSIPNLATLSRLVHASPVFHAQYLLDRKSILTRVLLTETTEDVFVDVYAAFRSRPYNIGLPTGPNTNVTSFLALYRVWRSPSASDRPTLETCSLDGICWMARFHQSTVNPLVTYFISWALANFRSSPVQPNAQSPEAAEDLTRTEKTRLTRALYRFEVFCHLFCGSQYERFVAMDINEVFFSNLDLAPWEAEEMNCIYAFVKQNYEAVLDDVKGDLNEENPKFDGQFEPELQGLAFPIDQDYDGFLNGTIGHGGLKLALEMIKAASHYERVDLMTKSLQNEGDFFEEAVGFAAQRHRRDIQFDDRDRAEERRQAMAFAGDDAGAPPLVWTLLWGGKYSNLFGEYIPDEIRRWGYVFWDAHRIDFDDTKDYLKDLWASSPVLMRVCRHWPWTSDVLEALGRYVAAAENH